MTAARRPRCPRAGFVFLLVAAATLAPLTIATAEPPAGKPPAAPDWAGIRKLLVGGDYPAAAAAADQVATAAGEPKPRDPDFLPRMIARGQALLLRGFAERQVGDLAAAEATVDAAFETFRDRDFQRLIKLQTRQGGAAIIPKMVPLELAWLELIHLKQTVLLEQLRQECSASATAQPTKAPASDDATCEDAVSARLAELARLERLCDEAREGLAERLNKAGGSLAGSPYNQALAGGFQATLADGLVSLELARLPFAVDRLRPGRVAQIQDSDPSAGEAAAGDGHDQRSEALAAAFASFAEANEILERAERAAAPKSGGLKPEQKTEWQRLRAELLGSEALGRLESGEFQRARAAGDEAVALVEAAVQSAKTPAGLLHPDLTGPLLLAADVCLAQAEAAVGTDAARARADVVAADRLIDRAVRLMQEHPEAFGENHSVHRRQAAVDARLKRQQTALATALPRSDAADAAARRALRGIERIHPSAASF